VNSQPPRFLYLQLHLLIALFASTAVSGRWLTLSAPALVMWRTCIASLVAALVAVWWFRQRWWLPRRQVLALLGIGAIVGAHWLCFFGAIRVANISICLAGMATISFFTAFTEPFFEKRRVRATEVLLGCGALVGILLIAGFERGRLLGLGIALLGAFLAAVFPVLNLRLVRKVRMDPMVMVSWEMAGASLFCLLLVPVLPGSGGYAGLFAWQGLDWLHVLWLALACTVFAHAFHIHLLRYLSAYTGNLAMNFEPVYGILAAALIFGEHRTLHPGFYWGAAAILAANLAHPLILRWQARR
jgi:drug/metabolite transporter (DMT)-like permease